MPPVLTGKGELMASAAPTGCTEAQTTTSMFDHVIASIRDADVALRMGEDWRDSYSCYRWNGRASPPEWAQVLANKNICPDWNTVPGCNPMDCTLDKHCAACGSEIHGVLDKFDGKWACLMTLTLAAGGCDVVHPTQILERARKA